MVWRFLPLLFRENDESPLGPQNRREKHLNPLTYAFRGGEMSPGERSIAGSTARVEKAREQTVIEKQHAAYPSPMPDPRKESIKCITEQVIA